MKHLQYVRIRNADLATYWKKLKITKAEIKMKLKENN